MRLSDLIKRGSDGEEEEHGKRKPASPPPAGNQESPLEEEESFRLSELPELRTPQDAREKPASPPDRAEDERPIEPPDFSREPPAAAPLQDAEPIAAPPDAGSFIASDEPASPPAHPRKPRKSVLAGPDAGPGAGDAPGGAAPAEFTDNPFAPLRERSLQFVTRMFQSVIAGTAYPLDEAEEIVYECLEDPDTLKHLYSLAVISKDTSNSLAIHLFNHSVYSLKLGRGLRWAEDRLIRLGVAALIHDLGMYRVPQEIHHKEGKLTPEELVEIQNHSKYGMETILELYGEPFRWLAEAIYHEHEREDGQGYPQGLSGNQISEYGKVIGLADTYEALTHNRPHRKRLLPHKAVQEIVQTQKTQFHQKLLKVMLEELSVFSLNSHVRLNSNAVGRVAETVPGQPLRPVIQLLFDADGNEIMEERFISLREFPLLYIIDEVEDSELPTSQ
ncbi:MAG: HD domain-containing phosphohydrolase [bacterium]